MRASFNAIYFYKILYITLFQFNIKNINYPFHNINVVKNQDKSLLLSIFRNNKIFH
jgi:hypothetical protein